MSTLTRGHKDHFSPGALAIFGLLLMLAAFVVDISTNPAPVRITAGHATGLSTAEQAASLAHQKF